MSVKRELKYFGLWFFWGPMGALAQRVPFAVVCRAGRLLGRAVFRVNGRARRTVQHGLGRMFPEMPVRDLRRFASGTFQNWCLAELENMLLAKLYRDGFYELFSIQGCERLDEALARGRGVILLVAHFGAHLQVLPALGFKGYKVNQLTNERPIDNPTGRQAPAPGFFEDAYFRVQERRHGSVLPVNMILAGGFMRPLFERLAHNEIVVIAAEGRAQGRMVSCPFLCHDAYAFSTGPVALGLKTGAAVLPVFAVRGEDDRNTLVIEEEIALDPATPRDDEIRTKTTAFAELLARQVRAQPDHCGLEFFSKRGAPPPGSEREAGVGS